MKITDLLENRGTLIPIVAVLCFAYTTYRGCRHIKENFQQRYTSQKTLESKTK